MKRTRILLMLLILTAVLLAGCEQKPPETQPVTEPPVETTEPTVPGWLNQEEYPSYDDFFAQDRAYSRRENASSWKGNDGKNYTLTIDWTPDHSIASLLIGRSQSDRQTVWSTSVLRGCTLLACDGKYAYFMDGNTENGYQILQVDLLAKKAEAILEEKSLVEVHICDEVMYYVRSSGSIFQIKRMYLPERKQEILAQFEMPAALFLFMNRPTGNREDLSWSVISPEMQKLLELELQKPESSYNTGDEMRKDLWRMLAPLQAGDRRYTVRDLAQEIELNTGIPAITEIVCRYGEYYVTTGGEVTAEPAPEKNWSARTEQLSYEAFFSEDRKYAAAEDACYWQGGDGRYYELTVDQTLIYDLKILYARCIEDDTREDILHTKKLLGYELIACDGVYAYFTKSVETQQEVIRLELLTDTVETVLPLGDYRFVRLCGNAVLYYAHSKADYTEIRRLYLPEMRGEVLSSLAIPAALLYSAAWPDSAHGDVTLTAITPQMEALIEAELEKQDSGFYSADAAWSVLWQMGAPLQDGSMREIVMALALEIERSTGTPAAAEVTYRYTDGTVAAGG